MDMNLNKVWEMVRDRDWNAAVHGVTTWHLNNNSNNVQFSHSVVSDSATPQAAARQASLSITNSWSLLKLVSIESVMSSNHLILYSPPAFSLSQHQGLFK